MATPVKNKDELLKESRELINEMQSQFERIGEAGLESAVVIDTHGKYALLSSGIYVLNNNFSVGQNVLIYPCTGQVVEDLGHNPIPFGELFVIDRVLSGPSVEL